MRCRTSILASSICAMAWRMAGRGVRFDIFLLGIETETGERLRHGGLAAIQGERELLLVEFGDHLAFTNVLAEVDEDGRNAAGHFGAYRDTVSSG